MPNLLQVEKLNKRFSLDKKHSIKALQDVSFFVNKEETLGIVGESGCGKTTLGKAIMGMYQVASGEVYFNGEKVVYDNVKDRYAFARKVQMIFQDPYSSMNPNMTIEKIMSEGMQIHNLYSKEERNEKIISLLEKVGLQKSVLHRYPHEFSGGQLQRINIARALVMQPEICILDEPTSALDVSIQSQIINLLKDLQKEFHLTYLFISHNLNVVRYISDRIMVMYLGKIVEIASSETLFSNPLHPYTELLLEAVVNPVGKGKKDNEEVKVDTYKQEGCPFFKRCSKASETCKQTPDLQEVETNHFVACHHLKSQ